MDVFRQDVRYAVRLLQRNPKNSAIAIAILALGVQAARLDAVVALKAE